MQRRLSWIATLAALGSLFPHGGWAAGDEQAGKRIDNARIERQGIPAPGEYQAADWPLPSGVSRDELAAMRAAAVPETPAQLERTLSDAHGNVHFESGYAELTDAARHTLDAIAAELRGKSGIRLAVQGHTDSQRLSARARERYPDNQALSEARALAVAQYLRTALGLDAGVVSIAGHGPSRPVADNGSPQGMARNRRVELRAWYREQAVVPQPVDGEACAAAGEADLPFRVTVDGEPLGEAAPVNEADRQRCADVALEKADIQVKYDDLATRAALNVWAAEDVGLRGQTVHFHGYTNYAAWIARAEVRLFRAGDPADGHPLAVLPLDWSAPGAWTVPEAAPQTGAFPPGDLRNGDYQYVLRVYDAGGRYDETAVKTLSVSTRPRPLADGDTAQREALTGWGENALALRNIPVRGGTITVSGRNLPAGHGVHALGMQVPVDGAGRFVIRQILPAGPHAVEIAVSDPDGRVARYRRNVSIPDQDWFYIALADITVGRNSVSRREHAELVTGDTDHYRNETWVDGRGAFYLKGRIKGEWLLTAAADTREQPLEDLFSNFSSKDPRYLLRNIDPDAYYPVYGDDSTTVDDAPTQGKFYVRLEKGDSHVMWGNFHTSWTGSELVQYSRGLYGARGRYVSESATAFGERRAVAEAFAADPGTLPAREEFRGTGGSLYYLRHQDITQGSERVWVEVRDRDSGLVLERRSLTPGLDYDINYLQGRLLLSSPLSSTAAGTSLVSSSALSGHPLHLVVGYEYVPGFERVDGLAAGVRATYWANDHLRLGLTGFRQGEDEARQTLKGADVLFRVAPGTTVHAEFARSTGAPDSLVSSVDGGYGFAQSATASGAANARRIEARVQLGEVSETLDGEVAAYWQDRDAGYTGPGQIAVAGEAVTQYGARAEVDVSARDRVTVKADARDGDIQDRDNAEAGWRRQLDEEWAVTGGVRHDERRNTAPGLIASPTLAQEGRRTDVVARLDYQPRGEDGAAADWSAYGYVQGTVARSGERDDNNRAGLGGSVQVNDRLRLRAEASGGSGGPGGLLGGEYRISDRSNAYLNYVIETEDPEYAWRGRHGTWVSGADYRVSETTRVFGENRYTHGAGPQGLTHAFGVDLAPIDHWTVGMKYETGEISDPLGGDFERNAVGFSVGYRKDKTRYAGSLEYRRDESSTGTGRTWLTRNSLGYQADPSWRLIGKLNVSRSSNSGGSFWDGDFHEIVLGAAYRPIDNDRWNTLVKYTNYHNVPSSGQLSASGQSADYAQRSQVFSIDTIWDARPWLSLGAKYGVRIGELKFTQPDSEWFKSRADLLVLRADWHFVREWDALLEWRKLRATEADDARAGALVAVYRHVGQHVKVGVGYNFTDYSDDLTDLSYDSRGWFLNVLATF
ncbi:OmpA family protein [Pseudothauera rhizosphaerae]|uniref:OmpA family protein n=2 Tax=Pseudothauera rhizosphaerae TaxID=2565932 RepID=A0A4V3WAU9_9RHOO|nr:OmpA family protein [Pseudothauera rhizosphaerae]